MAGTISIREGAYGGWETASEYIADAGIRHLEVEMRPVEELLRAAETLRAKGLDIATVSGGVNLDSEASMDHLRAMIAACRDVQVPVMFVSAGGTALDRPTHMARLRSLAESAAEAGVTIALETHPPFCQSADGMLQTMSEVNHPNLRLNLDTANIYYYNRGLNSAEELERVVDYVASVHLKDTDGGFESPNFPVLGQGVVDFPRIKRALDAAGFNGPLTLELEGPVLEGLDIAGRHGVVMACMDYLRSIGMV